MKQELIKLFEEETGAKFPRKDPKIKSVVQGLETLRDIGQLLNKFVEWLIKHHENEIERLSCDIDHLTRERDAWKAKSGRQKGDIKRVHSELQSLKAKMDKAQRMKMIKAPDGTLFKEVPVVESFEVVEVVLLEVEVSDE